MEKFITQFFMSGVKTDVTVEVLGEEQFAFVIHIIDEFEGGELTPAEGERDAIIARDANGRWNILGKSKIHLSDDDIQNLGGAIEQDYLRG